MRSRSAPSVNANLDIEQVIVCGHSHCGAMQGLLKMSKLADQMPLIFNFVRAGLDKISVG